MIMKFDIPLLHQLLPQQGWTKSIFR